MVTLVLITDFVLACLLAWLIISARKFVREIRDPELKPFKTNIIIESSLSLDL